MYREILSDFEAAPSPWSFENLEHNGLDLLGAPRFMWVGANSNVTLVDWENTRRRVVACPSKTPTAPFQAHALSQ